MTRQTYWKRMLTKAYRVLLALYPSTFRAEFAEEMQDVFTIALEESQHNGKEHPWQLFGRELRHLPGSVLGAHLRARRWKMTTHGINLEKPLSRGEWLAAMSIFMLPLFSLFAITEIDLPQWTNYIVLVLFWGCILFALVLAIVRRLPGWSLPYLGFALMLWFFLSPGGEVWDWIYPIFLKTFGARSHWSIPLQVIYAGVFEFIMSLTILLGAFTLVNLLRLLPFTRAVWERIRADWTQLPFMLYGGLVLYIMIAFEEYRHDDLWKFSAWVCLALGAWLYLRGKGHKQRILALLGGTTGAFWIVALAKWMLIPLQKWPVGYPISPSIASRWVETGSTLLSWLFILGILSAPALLKWLPPLPVPIPAEENEPANARAA